MGFTWGFSIAELHLPSCLSPLTWSCLSGEQPELLFVQLLWDHFVVGGVRSGQKRLLEESFHSGLL